MAEGITSVKHEIWAFFRRLKRKTLGTEGQGLHSAGHCFSQLNGCDQLPESDQDLA